MERFIKEYAKYQKESINSCELMKEGIKENALNRINSVLKAREKGLITVTEAMLTISNVLNESI